MLSVAVASQLSLFLTMTVYTPATVESTAFIEMAAEVESEKADLNARLATKQAEAAVQPAGMVGALVNAASSAAAQLHLDEAETRRIIDSQLRQAGWTVDTENIRFSKGARPENSTYACRSHNDSRQAHDR